MQQTTEIFEETPASLRAQMLHELRLLGEATAPTWERAVFRALTGRQRDDLDWDHGENYLGYIAWLRAFAHSVAELVTEGAVVVEERDGETILVPLPAGPLS